MSIHAAINGVMQDIGAIGKDKKNQQQGFNYRGVDDVMNALQPALVRHKMYVVPEVLELDRTERTTDKGKTLLYTVVKVKYTFYAEDGSSVSATVIGEGMDSADKSANKAMSIAFKYACFQVFCIPTEEMIDPDAETPPPSKPTKSAKIKKTESPEPLPPEEEAPPERELPSDVLQMEGADKADNKTLFVHALKIGGIEVQKGRELLDEMFGADIQINDLTDKQFIEVLKALDEMAV